MPSALKVWNLNHWTTRKSLDNILKNIFKNPKEMLCKMEIIYTPCRIVLPMNGYNACEAFGQSLVYTALIS